MSLGLDVQVAGQEVEGGYGLAAGPAPAGAARPSALSSSHICPSPVGPTVSWAKNARWSKVKIPGKKCSAGGRRGAITGFSAESRNRLLVLVNSIDQVKSKPELFRFVTLTYPKAAPTPREAKQHLHNVLRRFTRAWGRHALIWKIEPQRRGAPHFHLLLLMGDPGTVGEELIWWASNWVEVIGVDAAESLKVSQVHLGGVGNRPCVEVVNSWGAVSSYVGKYLGKVVNANTNEDGWAFPGRWWGTRHAELLPITRSSVELPSVAAVKIKRVLVKWYEHQKLPFAEVWALPGEGKAHRWCRIPPKEVERLASGLSDENAQTHLRHRCRKWRGKKGGISCFLGESDFLRVCEWACRSAGLTWRYVYGDSSKIDHDLHPKRLVDGTLCDLGSGEVIADGSEECPF